MAYNRNNNELNEEKIASFLQDAVKNVEGANASDIEVLEQIKKLIKKNVPFSRRKYVYAMLVKNATMGFRSNRFNKDKNERFHKNDRAPRAENTNGTEERHERAPRVQIDEAVATTIFIGIGHNRRVAPRDLVGLLVSVAGLERVRIGEIRVLANYSFIQLYTEDCEKAISALNGYEYRGRKLSVSYSRKKEEGEATEAPAENKASEVVEPVKAYSFADETIPENVSNEGHADTSVNTEAAKLAAEQAAYAQTMASSSADVATNEEIKPFAETTDDGQVKSHFGDGAAY